MRKVTIIIALFSVLSLNAQYFDAVRNPASYSTEETMFFQGWEYYGAVNGYCINSSNSGLIRYQGGVEIFYREYGRNVTLRVVGKMDFDKVFPVRRNPDYGDSYSIVGGFEYRFYSDAMRKWVYFNIE